FFQRQQDGLAIVCQQLGGLGIGGVDAGMHLGAIEEAPVDAQYDAACLGCAGEEVGAAAGERTEQTVQGEARKQIGTCDTDACTGGGQSSFRCLNIGTTTQ